MTLPLLPSLSLVRMKSNRWNPTLICYRILCHHRNCKFFYVCIYVLYDPSIVLSIFLNAYLSIYLLIYPSINLSLYMPIYLYLHTDLCPSLLPSLHFNLSYFCRTTLWRSKESSHPSHVRTAGRWRHYDHHRSWSVNLV